ncbi:hypothetical protein [Streptomyces sp. NPDC050560]|uniref:hypothetical protein n=1 Tax=Streptomyces sp. NPDC050560 TaxID=3365630 RepID=UPI00378D2182
MEYQITLTDRVEQILVELSSAGMDEVWELICREAATPRCVSNAEGFGERAWITYDADMDHITIRDAGWIG